MNAGGVFAEAQKWLDLSFFVPVANLSPAQYARCDVSSPNLSYVCMQWTGQSLLG